MVKAEDQMPDETTEQAQPPGLGPEDFFKMAWLVLMKVGGVVTIAADSLAAVPEDAMIEPLYDEAHDAWVFAAKAPSGMKKPLPRRGKIIRPSRRIIRP